MIAGSADANIRQAGLNDDADWGGSGRGLGFSLRSPAVFGLEVRSGVQVLLVGGGSAGIGYTIGTLVPRGRSSRRWPADIRAGGPGGSTGGQHVCASPPESVRADPAEPCGLASTPEEPQTHRDPLLIRRTVVRIHPGAPGSVQASVPRPDAIVHQATALADLA